MQINQITNYYVTSINEIRSVNQAAKNVMYQLVIQKCKNDFYLLSSSQKINRTNPLNKKNDTEIFCLKSQLITKINL